MRDLSHVMGLRNRIPLILERSKASGIDDPSNAPHLTRSRPTLGNLDVRYKVKSIVRVPVAQLRGQPIAKGDFFVFVMETEIFSHGKMGRIGRGSQACCGTRRQVSQCRYPKAWNW